MPSSNKIAAIYDLREAAETKAKAQVALEQRATPEARDALLDAQIDLEVKTADAVEACHDCDDATHGHGATHDRGSGVIDVDFGSGASRGAL